MALDQRILGAPCFAAAMMLCGAALADAGPAGVWINDTGRGAIEIKPCGDALCGHVVWLKDSADAKGCGKQIIGDAAKVAANTWDNGWIYSPEKKARYDVELKPLDNGTLRVTGYAGTKFFSKTMIWTRAPDTLRRCGTEEASRQPASPATVATAKPDPEKASAAHAPEKVAEVTPPPPIKTEPPAVEKNASPPPAAASSQPANAPPASKPENAPAPTEKSEARAAGKSDSDDDDQNDRPTKALKDFKIDKVFKRTASGDCKLNLPWIKVRFKCGSEE